MAGVLYPDFLGTLSKAAAFESNRAQTDYLNEDRAAKAEIAPLIPKALQGDKEALNQIGARHPDTFTKLMPMLQSIDANQRAKVKETSEWTTRAAMGVLSLPENERPAAYQAALADGQRLGYQIDMPPQYDRAVEGRLKHILNQARPIADYWKNQDEGVTLVPSGGGAAPGGFTGQVAKDESGGNYNIPNAKGSGAYGKYQFMPDTWASVAQSNPQLNLPMNMRQATPQQQEAAMEAFTRMNGQQLAQSGVPATPANLYLAHRFGAAGATRFLSAPDNTPIAQVFPANWIQQNPDLNTTVGQFKRGVQSRYGGIPAGREVDVASEAAPMPQPPGLAQGDAAPRGDASGNPIQTSDGGSVQPDAMKMIAPNLPPGTSLGKNRKTGQYIVQEGHFVVYDDVTKNPVGLIPVPLRSTTREQGLSPGYRWSADRTAQEFIPGGPADPNVARNIADAKRKADEKTIPQSVTKGVQENLDNLKEVDRAIGMLAKTPGGVGGPGSILAANIPGAGLIQNWIDKDGTDVRAKIANIGSLIVHQRSGAAVTASEFPRLKPFIPTISDDPATVKRKLDQFKQVYEEVIRDTLEYYGPENGFRPYTPATNYINRDQTQAPAAVTPPPAAPVPAPAPAPQPQPAPQTPSPADRGRSQFDLKKKYGLE